jgi:hypothetical protein
MFIVTTPEEDIHGQSCFSVDRIGRIAHCDRLYRIVEISLPVKACQLNGTANPSNLIIALPVRGSVSTRMKSRGRFEKLETWCVEKRLVFARWSGTYAGR